MPVGDSESSSSLPQSEAGGEDQLTEDMIAEGGTRIVWEDRWHERRSLRTGFRSTSSPKNPRRLDTLKELVAEGSRELGVRGYREIGVVRTAHHERRARRGSRLPLSILSGWSPSWWLAHGIPLLLGSAWIALIAVAIVTA
jgi:hypothetical protein